MGRMHSRQGAWTLTRDREGWVEGRAPWRVGARVLWPGEAFSRRRASRSRTRAARIASSARQRRSSRCCSRGSPERANRTPDPQPRTSQPQAPCVSLVFPAGPWVSARGVEVLVVADQYSQSLVRDTKDDVGNTASTIFCPSKCKSSTQPSLNPRRRKGGGGGGGRVMSSLHTNAA